MHVPLGDEERVKFNFSSEIREGDCDELPLRKGLSPQKELKHAMHLFRASSCPRSVPQLLSLPDAAILRYVFNLCILPSYYTNCYSVHITFFKDVTCIGFSLPHCFADINGVGIIMSNWCSIMKGENLPRLPSPTDHRDKLADVGSPYPSNKKGVQAFRAKMQGSLQVWNLAQKMRFYSSVLPEVIFHSKEEVRLIFVPLSLIEKLRSSTMNAQSNPTSAKKVFVSENDILTALLAKVC